MNNRAEAQKRDCEIRNSQALNQRMRELDELAKEYEQDPTLDAKIHSIASSARNLLGVLVIANQRRQFATAAFLYSKAEQQVAWISRQLLLPAATRGIAMLEGPRKPRLDPLGKLMAKALRASPKATARGLLDTMERIDGGRVIQEIDRDDPDQPVIHWRNKKVEESTCFRSFQGRVTRLRKKIQSGKIALLD